MPNYNCCVPGCSNSHRNKPPGFKFYCIPKDPELRKKYDVLLRNDSLKADSRMTRICSDHWEGGEKLSRNHLPTLFPWSKAVHNRRELKRTEKKEEDERPCKRKTKDRELIQTETEQPNEASCEAEPQQNTPRYVSCGTQTDDQMLEDHNKKHELEKEIETIKRELETLKIDNSQLKCKLENYRFDIDKYKDSDKDIDFYTGFTTYQMLTTCYSLIEHKAKSLTYERLSIECHSDEQSTRRFGRPRTLTPFQEFVLVLIRLRLGLFARDLAHRFKISETTVSKITKTWIKFLRFEFGPLITLPERKVIKYYSPLAFKELYPDVVIVVDCTEVEMERPSALNNQSACYSSYKSRPTMKALLGITPSGVLAFISDFFPGSASDKEITERSKFLDILKSGDAVMADKGFNVQDELASVGVTLVMPHFLKGKTQFSSEECNNNKSIASLRIHVERLMERIKNWHILDRRIPITMAPYASDMLFVIGALSNFLPPLIS